ncbi:MAG: IS4 family transposase [Steroidobacteraceae bacterium]
MFTGKLVFAQLIEHLPLHTFRRCVARYGGQHKVKSFSCLDQLLVMMFAQLTFRESLRDIEACLRAQPEKIYHMGIRGGMARNTLANANAMRDWRIYAEFAQRLIRTARDLYASEPLGVQLDNTVYALDSTTIDLCLSLFPWAPFRSTKAAVKLHTLLDLRGNIPTFLHISDGKLHDVNILDQLIPEAGAFYVVDRGYVDFERLARFDQAGAFFVTRAKRGMRFKRLAWRKTDRSTGVICDHTIALTVFYSKQGYPKPLRRIRFKDPQTGKKLVFITNHLDLEPLTVCQLYKMRWQVELFFKWLKQHLRIKAFFGTSENAVKSQIWIAVCTYVLVAIVRKRLNLEASMHEILQILSLSLFEKTSLDQLLTLSVEAPNQRDSANQLILFE